MLEIIYSKRFIKDSKKLKSNKSYNSNVFRSVVSCLINKEKLDRKYSDHALNGEMKGYRECHLKSDLLLIYQTDEKFLKLIRIGNHAELFE